MLDSASPSLNKRILIKTSLFMPKSAQRGQGMTEYIIIVALIAVAAIGAFTYFGQTIRSQTAGIANEVAGKSATDQISAAGKAAGKATEQADKAKGLSSYDGNEAQAGGK